MAAGRRFGKYLLHDRIAVGGMGELHLATEIGAAAGTPPYVLKILLPEYSGDAEYVSMFHDEARIGMQLAHPNIVAVHDLGRVGDSNYLVLEYVHGENLRTLQNRIEEAGEKFPAETAIRIGIEVLHGLEYAHKAKDGRGKPLQLVHRDLSPDNVMMSFDGDVKVLDFGIAKSEGRATETQFGILKGKVQYMSPEQALGQAVDARADLYAIGLVLLEIITGERRFAAASDPVQMIRDARVWSAKGPSESDPSLPIELDAILLKSLHHDPARRWQTAGEFSAALTRLLRGGGLPQAPEHLPALLRRLFPDRAEPFLQIEPTAGNAADAAREAALRIAPTNPGLAPAFAAEPGDESVGAFLSRGQSVTSPRLEPSEDQTIPGVRRDVPVEDVSERTVVASQPVRPAATTPMARMIPPPPPPSLPPAMARPTPAPPQPARPRTPRPPPPAPPAEPEDEVLADETGDSTRIGAMPVTGRTRTPSLTSTLPSAPSRTRNASAGGPRRRGAGPFLLAAATVLVLLAAGAVALRDRLPLPAGARATPEHEAQDVPESIGAGETVEATPAPEPEPSTPTTATPAPMQAKGGGMFPGEITDEVESTRVETPVPAGSPERSP